MAQNTITSGGLAQLTAQAEERWGPTQRLSRPHGLVFYAKARYSLVMRRPVGRLFCEISMAHMVAHQNLRRRLAGLLRRCPSLHLVLRASYRLFVTRFTAGVVGVILNDQGQMLVVEHVFHPQRPWGLPGGWLRPGERPVDALHREVLEETGMAICILAPLLVDILAHKRHLDIAYLCRTQDNVAHLNVELLDHQWVPLDAAPPLLPFHQAAVEAALARREMLEGLV